MSNDIRIRFDSKFDAILDELRSSGYFSDLYSIALFCGSLGFRNKSLWETPRGTREVRHHLLTASPGASELIDFIFLSTDESYLRVGLGHENLVQRVRLFEQYVNGGLESLKELTKTGRSITLVIPEIINGYWSE